MYHNRQNILKMRDMIVCIRNCPFVFGPVRIHKVKKVALIYGLFPYGHCIKASRYDNY